MFASVRSGLAMILVVLMSAVAFGQSAVTGAVTGSVLDPSNAVIPNASVALRSLDTNKEDTALTGEDGRFRFGNLQPGTYSLKVTMQGFGEYRQELIVEVGKIRSIDAALKLGTAASTTVEVVEGAATVNTESKEFSSNFNQTAINELPINGRRWSNFVMLAPGVVPDGSFGLLSFRGVSGLMNNNTVDGGDNNQAFFGEERGRTRIPYSISQSAIREFQVNTSNYSAEYGRAAGGVTNAVTKSGTNELHGDLFYFQRNNAWGARNPLAFQSVFENGVTKRVGIKPEDIRHQFGGTIGGPIKKDRVFFFFSYDQQRRNFPGLAIFFSPTYLDPANINRTALQASPRNLTNAQIDDTTSFLNSLTGPTTRRGDQTLVLPKIDWQVNSRHSFSANYNRLRWNSPAGRNTQPTNTIARQSFGDDLVNVDWGTARVVSTLSSTTVNEFRVQYGRDFELQRSQEPLPGEPRTSINGSVPEVFLTNGLTFGKSTDLERRKYPDERRTQLTDSMTIARGRGTFKFGGDFNHVKNDVSNMRFESGGYSYSNINDFIIDYQNWKSPLPATVNCVNNPTRFAGKCYTSNFQQAFGNPAVQFSTDDVNFYVQYDWKAFSRVTVNLGMRYEYQTMPEIQNPNPSTDIIPNTQVTLNYATTHLPNDKNNFAPRVGLAADVTGDGKTAVRIGYGLYHGRIINSTIYNALINTGVAGKTTQFSASVAPTATIAPVFPNVLTSAPAGTAAIQFFSSEYGAPQIHQADLVIEREILRNTTFSGSYLLSIGRKLPSFYDRNLSPTTLTQTYSMVGGPLDGQTLTVPAYRGTRPNTRYSSITEIVSTIKSTYNAMVLQVNRQFSRGLQFQASYTLAKASDTLQTSTTFSVANRPTDVFNPEADHGRSNFDRRHKVSMNAIFAPRVDLSNRTLKAIADGWSIAPIYQYYTGLPIDPGVSGSLPSGTGIANATSTGINGSGGTNRVVSLPRNAFNAPNIWNVDLRLSRRFYVKEGVNFEFLAEAFNIFNRTQVTFVNSSAYTISGTAQAAVMTYQSAFKTTSEAGTNFLTRERQIQLGLRMKF